MALDAALNALIGQPRNTLKTKVGDDSVEIPVRATDDGLMISAIIIRPDGEEIVFDAGFQADFPGVVLNTIVAPTADNPAVCTALIPVETLQALEDSQNLVVITPAQYRACMNKNHPECGTRTFWAPAANTQIPTGFTGTGVVIGVVDQAIDLTCEDLKNADGTTRVRYAWVQQDLTGTPPAGLYGSEYSNTQINAAIPASLINNDEHGTAVLGAAAGNGRATGNGLAAYRYPGMAPNATIVFVQASGRDTASLVDACAYVFTKAAALGMPAVFLLPFATADSGPNDGKDPLSLALNGLQGAGKVIVCPAGNDGALASKHAKVTVPVGIGQIKTMEILFPAHNFSGPQYVNFSFWYDIDRSVSLKLISPNGYVLGPFSTGSHGSSFNPHPDVYRLEMNFIGSTGWANRVEVRIAVPKTIATDGIWKVEIANLSGSLNAPVDAWMLGNSGGQQMLALCEFTVASRAHGSRIGSPGAATKVITVGAYAIRTSPIPGSDPTQILFDNMKLSSPGPTRDGRTKPEICASGNIITSMNSVALADEYYYPEQIADDGAHVHMTGTSMAAAIVAGGCALMLQINPAHSSGSILTTLLQDVFKDSFTDDALTGGAAPNQQWGNGKVKFKRAGQTHTSPPPKVNIEED